MARAHPVLLAASLGLAALGWADGARAEYVENFQSRQTAGITLATAGSVALGFDIAGIVYIADGGGDEWGRIFAGVGSLVGAAGLVGGSVIALVFSGESNIPAEDPDDAARRALTHVRVISTVNLGLAAASVGLGIASLVMYDGADTPEEMARWWLTPMILPDGGAGLGAQGTFE